MIRTGGATGIHCFLEDRFCSGILHFHEDQDIFIQLGCLLEYIMHFYLDYTVCENVTPFRNDHTIEADWAKDKMAPAARDVRCRPFPNSFQFSNSNLCHSILRP